MKAIENRGTNLEWWLPTASLPENAARYPSSFSEVWTTKTPNIFPIIVPTCPGLMPKLCCQSLCVLRYVCNWIAARRHSGLGIFSRRKVNCFGISRELLRGVKNGSWESVLGDNFDGFIIPAHNYIMTNSLNKSEYWNRFLHNHLFISFTLPPNCSKDKRSLLFFPT